MAKHLLQNFCHVKVLYKNTGRGKDRDLHRFTDELIGVGVKPTLLLTHLDTREGSIRYLKLERTVNNEYSCSLHQRVGKALFVVLSPKREILGLARRVGS